MDHWAAGQLLQPHGVVVLCLRLYAARRDVWGAPGPGVKVGVVEGRRLGGVEAGGRAGEELRAEAVVVDEIEVEARRPVA